MFIIDFNASEADIILNISNRDYPSWTIPVFDFIRSWFDKEVSSFAVQTSGSTSAPKVIHHSREAMIASAERTCDFFQLKENDTALLALPATHIGGKMMIVRSIIRGMKLICVEPKSNPLLTLINSDAIPSRDGIVESLSEVIDFAAFTPMQMSMMLDTHPMTDRNLSLDDTVGTVRDLSQQAAKLFTIKKIILGGAEIPYVLRQRLQDIQPSVYETYGMTETVSHIALKKINGTDRSDYFTILNGVKISTDERGCLVIDAPHLSDELLHTNDLVRIISDTQFQWLGRYDNIINTGGIKVSAEEIERKLQPFIKVNFFVAGVADDILGQKVSLILETSDRNISLPENHIEVLSKFEKPRQILCIEKFSYTENGKVNKKETLHRISLK